MQVPFTQDLQTAAQLLDQTHVGMAGQQTAIGDALGLASSCSTNQKAKHKVMILVTDGNDTASRMPPEKAAEIAGARGITVHTDRRSAIRRRRGENRSTCRRTPVDRRDDARPVSSGSDQARS